MKLKSQKGFSLIEVMVGVLIVSIASLGIVLCATYAKGTLRSVAIKEIAVDELVSFVEFMKGRIADGHLTVTETMGNYQGQTVFLEGDKYSNKKIPAKIYYDHMTIVQTDSASRINRRYLRAWITWQDFSSIKKVTRSEEIEMVMMEFPR